MITEDDFNKVKIDYETAKSDYEKDTAALESAKVKVRQALDKAKEKGIPVKIFSYVL